MSLLFGDDERVAKWAARNLGLCRMGAFNAGFVRPFVAVGVTRDKELIGAAIFNNYDGSDVSLTVVGRGVMFRGVFRALAFYAFDQLMCERVSATVRVENVRMLNIAERLGFKREGLIRKKYGDADAVILGLLKEECKKWIWHNERSIRADASRSGENGSSSDSEQP